MASNSEAQARREGTFAAAAKRILATADALRKSGATNRAKRFFPTSQATAPTKPAAPAKPAAAINARAKLLERMDATAFVKDPVLRQRLYNQARAELRALQILSAHPHAVVSTHRN